LVVNAGNNPGDKNGAEDIIATLKHAIQNVDDAALHLR
jgi:hypothetical protein